MDSPVAISYRCSIVTKCVSPAVFEILALKHNWVTTLTFLCHVTSSVTCPFDSQYVISYQCLIDTEPLLSLIVFGIFAFSCIWVTTLTFCGHVTLSIMWPMDSPVAISYRCSIVTKCVSPAVFEIFGSKLQSAWPVQIVTAHARYHVTCTPYAKFGYIFQFLTPTLPIHYDTFIKNDKKVISHHQVD